MKGLGRGMGLREGLLFGGVLFFCIFSGLQAMFQNSGNENAVVMYNPLRGDTLPLPRF